MLLSYREPVNIQVTEYQLIFSNSVIFCIFIGFLGGSDSKKSACNAGYPVSIPESGKFPQEGNGYPPLAWRIPRREEPGRLQPMGSQRVGHD